MTASNVILFFQLDEYTKQEEELASVEGEIQILTHENEDYKRRVDQVMEKIEQKKIEISQLEIEYKRFQSERNVSRKYFMWPWTMRRVYDCARIPVSKTLNYRCLFV